MSKQEILNKNNALEAESSSIFKNARGRSFTPAERTRLDAIDDEVEKLNKEIAELEEDPWADVRAQMIDKGEGFGVRSKRGGRDWGSLCAATRTPVTNDDWRSSGEFFAALLNGGTDLRLTRAQGELVDSSGGFMVPGQVAARILDGSLEREVVRPRARIVPMQSREIRVPAWDHSDRSGGATHSGITARWESESATLATDTAKLREVKLIARKLAFLAVASSELLEDATAFGTEFERALIEASSFHLDDAFLNGDGAGKPLGVLNSACTIEVAKESGQAASTIVYENLVAMYSRLLPASRQTATWVCSHTALPQLLTLSLPIGTGGSAIRVLNEQNGTFRALGLPLVVSEKLPTVGSAGDILLCDFNQYLIGLRTGVAIVVSPHLLFDKDQVAFRLRIRLDGQPSLDKAQTPKAGNSLSAFVRLAARS